MRKNQLAASIAILLAELQDSYTAASLDGGRTTPLHGFYPTPLSFNYDSARPPARVVHIRFANGGSIVFS